MQYPDRGSTVYQDLIYVFYMVATNAAIMSILLIALAFFMSHYGYKTIHIKFSKKNKYLKQLEKKQKRQEDRYIDGLHKKVKTKK
jgi:hypothetical protein